MTRRRPTRRLYIGVDVGTTSCKAALVAVSGGVGRDRCCEVVATAVCDTHASLDGLPQDHAEQNPDTILAAVKKVLKDVAAHRPREPISCIGVSGQMHGCMLWTSGRHPSHSSLVTWEDRRASGALLARLNAARSRHLRPWLVLQGYGCATLAWLLEHDRECLTRFTRVGTIMDYVVDVLSGGAQKAIDPVNAASFGLFDVVAGDWDWPGLARAKIPHSLLPPVLPTGTAVGSLVESAAHELGIAPGTALCLPTGDHASGMYASLCLCGGGAGTALVSIGTSSQMAVLLGTAQQEASVFLRGIRRRHSAATGFDVRPYVLPGVLLGLAAPSTGGNAMAQLILSASGWAASVASMLSITLPTDPASLRRIHKALDEAAAEVEVDDGLSMVPTFAGERTQAPCASGCGSATGAVRMTAGTDSGSSVAASSGVVGVDMTCASLTGVTGANFTLPRMYAACCEGVVDVLAAFMPTEVLADAGVRRLVGSGGALTRSTVLQRALARRFRLPLQLELGASRSSRTRDMDPGAGASRVDAAVGAALLASAGPDGLEQEAVRYWSRLDTAAAVAGRMRSTTATGVARRQVLARVLLSACVVAGVWALCKQ